MIWGGSEKNPWHGVTANLSISYFHNAKFQILLNVCFMLGKFLSFQDLRNFVLVTGSPHCTTLTDIVQHRSSLARRPPALKTLHHDCLTHPSKPFGLYRKWISVRIFLFIINLPHHQCYKTTYTRAETSRH